MKASMHIDKPPKNTQERALNSAVPAASDKRVLLVNHDLTISGASLMLLQLAEHLIQSGFVIDVAAVRDRQGALREQYEALGAAFPDQLNTGAYCLCIANTIFSAQFVTAIADHVKTIWWIHEADNGLHIALTNAPLYKTAFAKAHRIVFPIPWLQDAIYKSFVYQLDEGRCVSIANGICLPDNIVPMEKTRRTRIVCVANIDMRKRQGDLLAALDILDDPEIEVIFIGQFCWLSEAGKEALAREQTRGTNRYHFLGPLPHAAAMRWLASADFLVHPAGVETQPLAPIEAAMLEIPMILADLDVYQGTWRHGHNCLLYGVGDIDLLAELIASLKRNPALGARLAREARQTARRFTQKRFLQRFDDLLDELLD